MNMYSIPQKIHFVLSCSSFLCYYETCVLLNTYEIIITKWAEKFLMFSCLLSRAYYSRQENSVDCFVTYIFNKLSQRILPNRRLFYTQKIYNIKWVNKVFCYCCYTNKIDRKNRNSKRRERKREVMSTSPNELVSISNRGMWRSLKDGLIIMLELVYI